MTIEASTTVETAAVASQLSDEEYLRHLTEVVNTYPVDADLRDAGWDDGADDYEVQS